MSDVQRITPDVEAIAADPSPKRFAPDAQEPSSTPSFRGLDSDNVVVISFRALQLQRIAELQDELLELGVSTGSKEALTEREKETIDAALAKYGKSRPIWWLPQHLGTSLLHIYDPLAKALRNYETLSQNAVAAIPRGATFVGFLSSLNAVAPGPPKWLGPLLGPLITIIHQYKDIVSILVGNQAGLGSPEQQRSGRATDH